ncbi:hypothetical protein BG000_011622 [Podila horticola]|nr:hypothetical protein BG000_011622 [Podila horticola]
MSSPSPSSNSSDSDMELDNESVFEQDEVTISFSGFGRCFPPLLVVTASLEDTVDGVGDLVLNKAEDMNWNMDGVRPILKFWDDIEKKMVTYPGPKMLKEFSTVPYFATVKTSL